MLNLSYVEKKGQEIITELLLFLLMKMIKKNKPKKKKIKKIKKGSRHGIFKKQSNCL